MQRKMCLIRCWERIAIRKSYAYGAAYVRAPENNMLTKEALGRIEAALDDNEIKQILRSCGYVGDTVSEMLHKERKRVWDTCLELSDEDGEISAALLMNDFHNIKTVLKCAVCNMHWEELMYEPTNVDCEKLYECVGAGSFSGLFGEYRDICEKAYNRYKSGGLLALEVYLDRTELEKMGEKTDGTAHKYTELLKLLANLEIFLRAKESEEEFFEEALCSCELIDKGALIRGRENRKEALTKEGYGDVWELYKKSPHLFEEWCDERKEKLLSEAEFDFFGEGAVFAYLIKKLDELKKIRLAIVMGGNSYA